MIKNYNLKDLDIALQCYQSANAGKETIEIKELTAIYTFVNKPIIYNIDIVIQLLSDYIDGPFLRSNVLYSESELCNIIKVKKLTLHECRDNGYISYTHISNSRTIRYDLIILLNDLKRIQSKNISVFSKIYQNKVK